MESPDGIEIVAQLTPGELREVRQVQSEVMRVDVQMRLMQTGAQEMWRRLYVKYQLPPDVQFDASNGVFFRQGVPQNGHVHAEDAIEPSPSVEPQVSPPNRAARRRARRKEAKAAV